MKYYPVFGSVYRYSPLDEALKQAAPDLVTVTDGDWKCYIRDAEQWGIAARYKKNRSTCVISGLAAQCGAVVLNDWMRGSSETMSRLIKYANDIALAFGYSRLLVSLVNPDKIQDMEDAGFKVIDEFKNNRSGNIVKLLSREVMLENKSL